LSATNLDFRHGRAWNTTAALREQEKVEKIKIG
jgi:hypothetical protein